MARTAHVSGAWVFLASVGRPSCQPHIAGHAFAPPRPESRHAQGSASDVPGGVAAATADLPSKTLCPNHQRVRRQLAAIKRSANAYHWCRRHPGWHLPINELWHRASRPCAPGEGTLVVCVVALANQSAGGCLVCRGYARPRHPMRTAKPCQRWRAACWCAQWAAVWRNSHCRGSLPSRWRAWLSALELMGSLPCQARLQRDPDYLGHVHDGAVSEGNTQYQPKCLRPWAVAVCAAWLHRHLQGLFNPLLGYVALNDTPLFGARKPWVSF